jgi:hypothetical protein
LIVAEDASIDVDCSNSAMNMGWAAATARGWGDCGAVTGQKMMMHEGCIVARGAVWITRRVLLTEGEYRKIQLIA